MNRDACSIKRFSEISTQINSTEDLQDLLVLIMDSAKELLNAEGASLLLYDNDQEKLIFDIVRGPKGNLLANKTVPLGKGIAGLVALHKQPMIIDDAANDARVLKDFDIQNQFTTRNILAVPLMTPKGLVGVLEVVNSFDGRNFSALDLELLQYLSNQAAIAIRNRQLFQDLEIRMNELQCIYEIGQTIMTNIDFSTNAENILGAIKTTLQAQRLSLILKDSLNDHLRVECSIGIHAKKDDILKFHENSVAGFVMKTGQPLVVRDIQKDPQAQKFQSLGTYHSNSFISLPVKYKNRVIGVINVSDKESGEPFDLFDFRVLSTVAIQIAEAYVSFERYEEGRAMEQLRKDLAMASLIQKNSLPQLPPDIGELKISYYYEACESVGGDFYDMSILGEQNTAFVIGDVSGKGVTAALFMEHVKTLLQGYIPRFKSPRTSISELNKKILSENRMNLFVTVFVAQVEMEFRQIRYASAGHNHQFLLRKNSGKIELLSGKGAPAGTFKVDRFLEMVIQYEPGDILILYTDGITEAFNKQMQPFGEDRLIQVIEKQAALPSDSLPDTLKAKILEEVHNFCNGESLQDDLTMLLVQL